MSKPNTSPAPRRKKTRAAVTQQRKAAIAKQRVQKENPDLRWDEIQHLCDTCNNLFATAGGVLPLLSNKELTAKIQDQKRLNVLARDLNNKLSEYRGSLNTIMEEHAGKKGSAMGTVDMMTALMVGSQYSSWQEGYQAEIEPLVMEITELYNSLTA